jgi:hypothetical protein
MTAILQQILDWSEVWAPLIPLIVLSFTGKQPRYHTPVIIYLWFALVIDAFIDAGWKFSKGVPAWMHPNNYLYNIHSIGRFICFSVFFYLLSPFFRSAIDKFVPLVAALFISINFLFFENFYERELISSRLFAVEAGLLLFYCLRYYLFSTRSEELSAKAGKDFWVVTGLSVYVVFNFFYFLFYTTLMSDKQYEDFVVNMWNFHNLSFIILCIFIARAFYVASHK